MTSCGVCPANGAAGQLAALITGMMLMSSLLVLIDAHAIIYMSQHIAKLLLILRIPNTVKLLYHTPIFIVRPFLPSSYLYPAGASHNIDEYTLSYIAPSSQRWKEVLS